MKDSQRKNRRIRVAAAIVAVLALAACLMLPRQSVEQQLRAIEAARAIPDSENAAVIYDKLLAEVGELPLCADLFDKDTCSIIGSCPWSTSEYPRVAEWIGGHKQTIAMLLEAAKFERCRFPIGDLSAESEVERMNRNAAIRGWAGILLDLAAGNDLGEGRIDDAIAKYRCIVQLGRHVCQQPFTLERSDGRWMETVGLNRLIELIGLLEPDNSELDAIEQLPVEIGDHWRERAEEMLRVERLLYRGRCSAIARVKDFVAGYPLEKYFESERDESRNVLLYRRVFKITIALARYRNKRGHWPASLDEVRELAPPQSFIDPVNGESLVYETWRSSIFDSTFKLYSKGKNGIDEGGRYSAAIDPNSLEVIVEEDDDLFWPPRRLFEESNTEAQE
ncbi:MAG: hypothetical protein JSU94_13985 [Phycisphaerales bacterium]|nr:MAG: hypothetical protein JSU94_13985 [Phycisphaerales bacterium]